MKHDSAAEALRRQILDLVREYHAAVYGAPEPFVPGQTPVRYAGRVFDDSELRNLVEASLEFWLTAGRWAERFEQEFAAWLGVRRSYLVSSGSSANLLALFALTSESLGSRRLERGDEVITAAAGFPTTVAPIVQYGAVPVYVDIDPVTYNVSLDAVRQAIGPRTKAIMLAHTLGNPFQAEEMRALADENGLWLIEDNCDALGSEYRGARTGTFGHLATSSFYPPHHMTMGEGGAVCTSDAELARIVLSMRDWGRDCTCASGQDDRCGSRFSGQHGALPPGYDHKYVYTEWGFNLKATEMQAAIGVAQLAKLDAFIAARRANHARLGELLAPASDVLVLPEATPGSNPSWFGFLMTVRPGARVSRADLVSALERAGVQTRMLFGGNLVRQPVATRTPSGSGVFRVAGELTTTDLVMSNGFWVGVYPGMSDDMLDHMAAIILSACAIR